MGVNKIVYDGETLVDLTADTVTAEALAEGVTAHDAAGNEITGTMPTDNVRYGAQSLTDAQKQQARENIGAAASGHTHVAADITDIENLLSGAAKVQVGTYVGTGGEGSDSPCSLTFNFLPKIIIISTTTNVSGTTRGIGSIVLPVPLDESDQIYSAPGNLIYSTASGGTKAVLYPINKVSRSGNTVEWYYSYGTYITNSSGSSNGAAGSMSSNKYAPTGGKARLQFNQSGLTYNYIAIG